MPYLWQLPTKNKEIWRPRHPRSLRSHWSMYPLICLIDWLDAAWNRGAIFDWGWMPWRWLQILLFSEVAAYSDWSIRRIECGTWLFWRMTEAGWLASCWLAGRLLRSCSSDCLPTKQRPHSNDLYLIVWFPTLNHDPYKAQWVTSRPRSDWLQHTPGLWSVPHQLSRNSDKVGVILLLIDYLEG